MKSKKLLNEKEINMINKIQLRIWSIADKFPEESKIRNNLYSAAMYLEYSLSNKEE